MASRFLYFNFWKYLAGVRCPAVVWIESGDIVAVEFRKERDVCWLRSSVDIFHDFRCDHKVVGCCVGADAVSFLIRLT
jgi:hypothetical protein